MNKVGCFIFVGASNFKQFRTMKKLCSLVVFCGMAASLFAWNSRGHMVVASIAYNTLTESQQKNVTELLKQHPEYQTKWASEYEKVKNDVELGRFLMMRASVWPDEIRDKTHPFKKYHKDKWHYITYKIQFPYKHDTSTIDGSKEPNVVWAVNHTKDLVENRKMTSAVRAIYLCWYIHVVGDIHQPLHCSSLFNETYPKGDKGGNDFFVMPKKAGVKLHAMWDGALGKGDKTKADKIKNQATQIIHFNTKAIKNTDQTSLHPRNWSLESFRISVQFAYQNGQLKGSDKKETAPPLPQDYTKNMKSISQIRCLESGKRLGNTLNKFSF